MTEIEDEEHISKALGQFRLALNSIMRPLRRYGQEIYVDGVSEEICNLAWQLHWKLEGVDMPYELGAVTHW